MRTYLSSLLAIALLGHALVDVGLVDCSPRDCHDFETHARLHQEPALAALIAVAAGEHSLASDDCHPSDGPCECQLSCGGGCSYVASQKTRLDTAQFFASQDMATMPVASSNDLVAHGGVTNDQTAAMPPPLRLHLLHQLLLI